MKCQWKKAIWKCECAKERLWIKSVDELSLCESQHWDGSWCAMNDWKLFAKSQSDSMIQNGRGRPMWRNRKGRNCECQIYIVVWKYDGTFMGILQEAPKYIDQRLHAQTHF